MNIRNLAIVATAALGAAAATPANAGWWSTHTHYCNCGHTSGSTMCGGTTTSTTSGGTTTTSGGTTTTTSGGTTTSTGGTAVPEPGMLGMMALGLLGVGFARSRKIKPRA